MKKVLLLSVSVLWALSWGCDGADSEESSAASDVGAMVDTGPAARTEDAGAASANDAGLRMTGAIACTNEEYLSLPDEIGGLRPHRDAERILDGCMCDGDSGPTVTLKRVAAKRATYTPHPDLPEFEQANVSRSNQRDLFFATPTFPTPSRENTQIFMMAQAGQRDTVNWGAGTWNRLTGQQGLYRDLFENDQIESQYALHDRSLVWNIWQNDDEEIHQELSEQIFVSSVFDNASGYLSSSGEKEKIVNAFVAYVKNRITADGKLIYLSGSSRGACLSLMIAKRLKSDADYENMPMILHLVDPVCKSSDDDLVNVPATARIDNPLNASYEARAVDLDTFFSDQAKKTLSVYSTHTGDNVVLAQARTFVDEDTPEGQTEPYELTWDFNGESKIFWTQNWVNYSHKYLGRTCGDQEVLDAPIFAHYSQQLERFYCDGDSRFNPETQNCCSPGVPHPDCCTENQYWSETTQDCLDIPECTPQGYIEPGSDPQVCIECGEIERLVPAGREQAVEQFQLNETGDDCERRCPICEDFTGALLMREGRDGGPAQSEPECVARVCQANATCGGQLPTGQCICNEGYVFDNASESCIVNPCQSTYYYYDGDECIDSCRMLAAPPGQTPHYDCELDECVGPDVVSPIYDPLTGACGAAPEPLDCGDLCPAGTECNDQGMCVCAPVCAEGQECGDDRCGGQCGVCVDGQECTPEGQCEVPCERLCTGRECGDDGCGGHCGLCEVGEVCNLEGLCVEQCVPDCRGRDCGDDGCGGLCGECPDGAECNQAGECIQRCVPDCRGRDCGDDGCGGSCGRCRDGAQCNESGECIAGCVPDCRRRECGDDGCGDLCGVCMRGQSCTELGLCEPVNESD